MTLGTACANHRVRKDKKVGTVGDVESIVEELLRYLKTHPHAGETLEGIVQWWLLRQRYIDATETIRQALLILEQEGYVMRIVNPDGVELFFAVAGRLSES